MARGITAPESAETIVVRGVPADDARGKSALAVDAYGQTIAALRATVDALARAGATVHDIVRMRIHVAEPAAWTTVGRAYTAFFGVSGPIATISEVPRSPERATIVEIEAHAVPNRAPIKSACERCGAPLPDDPHAASCGWDCSFCGGCTAEMDARCPNCSGVLVTRRRAAPLQSR